MRSYEVASADEVEAVWELAEIGVHYRLMQSFTITSYGNDFFTGVTSDGRQVLMGLLCPNLVAVFFDAEGSYLSHDVLDLTMLPPRMGVTGVSWQTPTGVESINGIREGPFKISDPTFQSSLANDIGSLKAKVGFIERPIRLRQFKLDGQSIGIELLPRHLAEFKTNPDGVAEDQEELNELQSELADWESSGNFVFYWAKDYWFGPNGQIEST